MMTVAWGPKEHANKLLLAFVFNDTTREVVLKEIQFALNGTVLPQGKNETIRMNYKGDKLSAPKGNSYYCTKVQLLNLVDNTHPNNTIALAEISHVQLEAFHKGDKQFSTAVDCDAINTPGSKRYKINNIYLCTTVSLFSFQISFRSQLELLWLHWLSLSLSPICVVVDELKRAVTSACNRICRKCHGALEDENRSRVN